MFALKAARDALNLAGGGLQVIATGSNRNKLAMLVSGREQPFLGATMVDFPTLDQHYIVWVCERANIGLDPAKTLAVFKETGSRPEMLLPSIRTLRLTPPSPDSDLDAAFAAAVRNGLVAAKADFLNTFDNLPILQAALLRELAEMSTKDQRLGLFSAAMVERLKARLQDNPTPVQVDASSIQSALDSLREKNFLWKFQRGAYWVEDEQLVTWLSA